jgi:outer membrane protein OmpA-like peptidoglycan-associated protein
MTQPGSAHPAGGAASRPPSPARLVLAVGLLGLGLGDLTVINMVLLPRTLDGEPGEHRPLLPSPPQPATARVTAQPPGEAQRVASPPPLDGTTTPPAPAAPAPRPLARLGVPRAPLAEPPVPPEAVASEPADVFPALQFALNATWLSPASRVTLGQLIDALKQAPQKRVVLRGHADRRGPEEFNRSLSLARARQARRYLRARGIEPARIEIQSFGSRRPADQEKTSAARARNRRVEIEIH